MTKGYHVVDGLVHYGGDGETVFGVSSDVPDRDAKLEHLCDALNEHERMARRDTVRDWAPCPVCGEPDMLRETWRADGVTQVHCTNGECASNGGGNSSALTGPSGPGIRVCMIREDDTLAMQTKVNAFLETHDAVSVDVIARGYENRSMTAVIVFRQGRGGSGE